MNDSDDFQAEQSDHSQADDTSTSEATDSGYINSECSETPASTCHIDDVINKHKQERRESQPTLPVPFSQDLLGKKTRVYSSTTEFSRNEIKRLKEAFAKYDYDKDNFIGFDDLKLMMEKLGIPQTHLALKSLIKEVDEDKDSRINFKEFLTIFKKARAGELGGGINDDLLEWFEVYVGISEISVEDVGVKEAKNFFESKIALSTAGNKYEREIREEQERRRVEEEAKRQRAEEFKNKRAMFS